MNGRKYIPSLDEYDNGERPTLSAWDEWDLEEAESIKAEITDPDFEQGDSIEG